MYRSSPVIASMPALSEELIFPILEKDAEKVFLTSEADPLTIPRPPAATPPLIKP